MDEYRDRVAAGEFGGIGEENTDPDPARQPGEHKNGLSCEEIEDELLQLHADYQALSREAERWKRALDLAEIDLTAARATLAYSDVTSVACKCVGCGHKETLTPIPSDVPMCSKCFSPMVVESVAHG